VERSSVTEQRDAYMTGTTLAPAPSRNLT